MPLADSPSPSGCSGGYWIVSSRTCQQSSRQRHPTCRYQYVHVPVEGNPHWSDTGRFLGSLQPGVPVCIVVHGSFVYSGDLGTDTLRTYRWLRAAAPDRPLQVVFFTWPSEGVLSIMSSAGLMSLVPQLDVAVLGRRSALNGLYLAQLLSRIPIDHPISLVGHSHGARVVSSALHLLGGGEVQGRTLSCASCSPHRIRAVLIAAAIDHHWLNPGERYGRALCRTECLLNLRNGRDFPLVFYPLRKPLGHRSLARTGFTGKDRARLGWLNERAFEWDVTPLIGTGHVWPNYVRQPQIACGISPFVYFIDQ